MKKIIILAILVTGGYPGKKLVEVLNSNGTFLCTLPDLPDNRGRHSVDGHIMCGGSGEGRSCMLFDGGLWKTKTWNLIHVRKNHIRED